MYKIAILGCENSHADTFLRFIYDEKLYTDVEVVGLYSSDRTAAEKLSGKYGIPVMADCGALAGQLDGVIVTARHGDEHFRFAKPYLADGIPMFIDKPITVSEADAAQFSAELQTHGIRVCGGSCCKHAPYVQQLKKTAAEATQVFGGAFRAPLDLKNAYGDFYFYAEHLVDVVTEIFGRFPHAVRAAKTGETITVLFRYDGCDVTGLYVNKSYRYFASVFTDSGSPAAEYPVGAECFRAEFAEFYALLGGAGQGMPYSEFFSPVYILNAIERALASGAEERVGRCGA